VQQTRRMRVVGLLAVACVTLIVLLNGKPAFTSASRPPRGISDPALAIQMARNPKEIDAILSDAPSPDREAMRIKVYIDFAFILCGAALLIALARMFRGKLATAGAACGVAAVIADIFENAGILRILGIPLAQTTQPMVDAILAPAYLKWALVSIALALFAALFLGSFGWLRKAIGAALAASAALGLLGLIENALLLEAGIAMSIGLALMVFLAWPREVPAEPRA
jgi:hypothetical protein